MDARPTDEIRSAPVRLFLLTLWAALTLNFFIPRFMPGNPAVAMVAESAAGSRDRH